MIITGVLIAFVSFTLSACVGLGGSLILVPAMILAFGTKQGIIIAALLLSINNFGKVFVYRRTIPPRCVAIIAFTMAGAVIGAKAMLAVDEIWVDIAVLTMILLTLSFEIAELNVAKSISAPVMAFLSGCTSGFSGTSGPLKGVAIRNLGLERMYFVGAASAVSLFGDVAKATVYLSGSLLNREMGWVVLCCALVSPLAVWSGRELNRKLGEQMFACVFWTVMIGYTVRLFLR